MRTKSSKNYKKRILVLEGAFEDVQNKLNIANSTVCKQIDENKWLNDRIEHLIEYAASLEATIKERDAVLKYLENRSKN